MCGASIQRKRKRVREGELRVQSRASERLQDQIVEEIKEMEHTKTRRSFANGGERT